MSQQFAALEPQLACQGLSSGPQNSQKKMCMRTALIGMWIRETDALSMMLLRVVRITEVRFSAQLCIAGYCYKCTKVFLYKSEANSKKNFYLGPWTNLADLTRFSLTHTFIHWCQQLATWGWVSCPKTLQRMEKEDQGSNCLGNICRWHPQLNPNLN